MPDARADYAKADAQYVAKRKLLNDFLVQAHASGKAGIDQLNASINNAIGDVAEGIGKPLQDAVYEFLNASVISVLWSSK